MMLYPAMGELSTHIHNRYMLVNIVARRARQIAQAYEEARQPLDEKPVTIAINEVAQGVLDPDRILPYGENGEISGDAESMEDAEMVETVESVEEPEQAEAESGGAEETEEEEAS